MSTNLNRTTVSGRLTRDIILKETRVGTSMASFDIACHFYAGKNEPDAVSFLPVRAFGSTADFISKFFKKGDEIYVDGVLREDRWQKEGQNCSTLYILARSVFFGNRKSTDKTDSLPDQPHDEDDDTETIVILNSEADLPF